ncbi:hypothetical protein JZ751_021972 [Albula glossodonta]|uniref:Uncharacterized protein n=1 Tax=Albula glossodonta TaxID=121402 RepID=A0A8T2NI46_9TELE|nr:hypothetical protein JZ751_021972 [Albula glossodonta]
MIRFMALKGRFLEKIRSHARLVTAAARAPANTCGAGRKLQVALKTLQTRLQRTCSVKIENATNIHLCLTCQFLQFYLKVFQGVLE